MREQIWCWLNERWPLSAVLRWGLEEDMPGGTMLPCRNLRIFQDSATRKNSGEQGKEVEKMAKDPVCCMEVDEKKAPTMSRHMGIGRIEL